jgi:hypothetical protein
MTSTLAQMNITQDYNDPNFGPGLGTDNYYNEHPNLYDSDGLNYAHEHGYAQNYEEPYGLGMKILSRVILSIKMR